VKNKTLNLSLKVISAMIVIFAGSGLSLEIINYGPFACYFYGTGDGAAADWTAAQKADVEASISTWDAGIENTAARQIRLDMYWVDFEGNTLGGASSSVLYNGTRSYTLTEYLWREETNFSTSGADALIQLDLDAAGFGWHFGSAPTPSNAIDFLSVVTHELGHLVGFASSYNRSLNQFGTFGTGAQNWVQAGLRAWDLNFVDNDGDRPVVASSWNQQTDVDVEDEPGGDSTSLYWDGENAVAANGGELVQIYAPATYAPGSSLSHLNYDSGPVYADSLMSPYVSMGVSPREPNEIEWAMMADMGWTLVPEPATAIIMCLGGFILKTTKKRSVN
jgi:hypothetical protein